MKPFLFLDIDGVLCPFGSDFHHRGFRHHDEWVRWNPENIEHLEQLKDSFTFVWASFWNADDANALLAPQLEIPTLPSVEFTRENCWGLRNWANRSIKLGAIEEHAGKVPFAWIDDDVHEDGFKRARERSKEIPTLIIRPDPSIGMTCKHVNALLAFAHTT